ncbi:MAG: hypothetical protein ACREJB_13450 [Planctomycetaceae bacterium]
MMFHAVPRESNRGERSLPRFVAARCLAAIALIAIVATPAPARVGVRSTGPQNPTIVHDGSSQPQVFAETRWNLRSVGEPLGATVQWTCPPFVHAADAALKVDSRLDVRVLRSNRGANWQVVLGQDQTDFNGGKQTATVVLSSQSSGNGRAGLTVTFLSGPFDSLAAGDYTLTVTATIAGN